MTTFTRNVKELDKVKAEKICKQLESDGYECLVPLNPRNGYKKNFSQRDGKTIYDGTDDYVLWLAQYQKPNIKQKTEIQELREKLAETEKELEKQRKRNNRLVDDKREMHKKIENLRFTITNRTMLKQENELLRTENNSMRAELNDIDRNLRSTKKINEVIWIITHKGFYNPKKTLAKIANLLHV